MSSKAILIRVFQERLTGANREIAKWDEHIAEETCKWMRIEKMQYRAESVYAANRLIEQLEKLTNG